MVKQKSADEAESVEVKEVTPYERMRKIDVSEYVETKGEGKFKATYLSWAWAVDQLLLHDPDASWEFGEPTVFKDDTVMVYCTVTAFGKARKMHLPVMDHKNAPIKNPSSFAMNTALMRCLVKAIALHGLGLYIYAGEDVPDGQEPEKPQVKENHKEVPRITPEELQDLKTRLAGCLTLEDLSYVRSLIGKAAPRMLKNELDELTKLRDEKIKELGDA